VAFGDPTYAELLERLEVLEARTLALRDLPLAALQRKLEQDWQPQASILLGENSITPAMLASALDLGDDALVLRVGIGTISFTASQDSTNSTITHGLGRVPTAVVATVTSAPNHTDIAALNVHTLAATTFGINGRKWVASTLNVSFYWLAIG